MARQLLVVGNWKMHGSPNSNAQLVSELLQKLTHCENEVAVCPPSVFIPQVIDLTEESLVKVGAQNVAAYHEGAYTGEVSASMLNDLGCRYCLVGHSERRTLFAETCENVAIKTACLLEQGITPICCVGETHEERQNGKTFNVILEQLNAILLRCGREQLKKLVIAYEPVWAIGTGNTATPRQAQEVHEYIHHWLEKHDAQAGKQVRILYGGSVNAENALELFSQPDISGALVGGASLKANDFSQICRIKG